MDGDEQDNSGNNRALPTLPTYLPNYLPTYLPTKDYNSDFN